MPSLHTTRLLLEVRTSAETLPAETLDAIEHALIYADSNRELGVLCTTRVSLLDPAIAMHVGLLADIDAYLAKQPVAEPERETHQHIGETGYAETHGGWEVAQALRNIIAKHRYDAYCAHSRRFSLQPLIFERWKEMQQATAQQAVPASTPAEAVR